MLSIQPASLNRSGGERLPATLRTLDRGDQRRIEKLLSALEDAPDAQGDTHLRCRACGRAITHADDGIRMLGAHEHTFTNPHGVSFTIGCFREAPGGTEIGEATVEHTWFAGYRWRIMLCGQCGTHLGWAFHAPGDDRFYALILDRLIAAR